MVEEHLPDHQLDLVQETSRPKLKVAKKIASVALAGVFGTSTIFAGDSVYTSLTEPERNSKVTIHDADSCKQASVDVVYLDPTGKSVSRYLAENNRELVKSYGGASYSMQYGTKDNVHEFAETINQSLSTCRDEPDDDRPVILVGQSLGGKKAQEIANTGIVKNVVGIIQEATPVDSDDIKDSADRLLVTTASDIPIVVGRKVIELSIFFGSYRRGVNPFDPIEQKFNRDSANETDPKVISWQRTANSKPYPRPLVATDNSVPIYYIYSEDDGVVKVDQALKKLTALNQAPVIPMEISRDNTSRTGLNHAEGWLIDRYNDIYKQFYSTAFDSILSFFSKPPVDECTKKPTRTDYDQPC